MEHLHLVFRFSFQFGSFIITCSFGCGVVSSLLRRPGLTGGEGRSLVGEFHTVSDRMVPLFCSRWSKTTSEDKA